MRRGVNIISRFIEDNGDDQSKLFRASKRLLNMQPDKTLPPYTAALTLANGMGEFFVYKITSIRSKLTTGDQYRAECGDTSDVGSADITFSEFSLLSEEDVRKLDLANKKSCALDPIPASILSAYLDELLPVVTRMVNTSLETGYFANNWKCALVHPRLKKHGLQLINKNFRPVSNLQLISKLAEKAVATQIQCHMRDTQVYYSLPRSRF